MLAVDEIYQTLGSASGVGIGVTDKFVNNKKIAVFTPPRNFN